jgi:hypothetical protein
MRVFLIGLRIAYARPAISKQCGNAFGAVAVGQHGRYPSYCGPTAATGHATPAAHAAARTKRRRCHNSTTRVAYITASQVQIAAGEAQNAHLALPPDLRRGYAAVALICPRISPFGFSFVATLTYMAPCKSAFMSVALAT